MMPEEIGQLVKKVMEPDNELVKRWEQEQETKKVLEDTTNKQLVITDVV